MTDNRENATSANDQQQFVEHLEQASQIVRSWPAWKQGVLGTPNNEESTMTTKRKTQKTLVQLKNKVIVLTVSFPGCGHVTVSGKVRFVSVSPACWVAECCLPPDTPVYPNLHDGPGHWTTFLKSE